MKHSLLVLLVLTIFTSCHVTKLIPVIPVVADRTIPALNSENEKEVGDPMIDKELSTTYDAIEVLEDLSISINNSASNTSIKKKIANKGDIFYNAFTKGGNKLYFKEQDFKEIQNGLEKIGFYMNSSDSSIQYFILKSSLFTFRKFSRPIQIKHTKKVFLDSKYFKQELIYNGKVGNSIKCTYREYVNDIARPAFTQDLQYDLSESSIIGIKGMRIEVIKTTNIGIKYKILNDFK